MMQMTKSWCGKAIYESIAFYTFVMHYQNTKPDNNVVVNLMPSDLKIMTSFMTMELILDSWKETLIGKKKHIMY
mgnify:CR=1 FL=1